MLLSPRRWLPVATAGLLAAFAAPAAASTLQLDAGTLHVTATPGERNDIVVGPGPGGVGVLVSDAAGLRLGPGCVLQGVAALCGLGLQVGLVEVDAGDGDDRVVLEPFAPAAPSSLGSAGLRAKPEGEPDAKVHGGGGNDHLESKGPKSEMDGGDGDDEVKGGKADDRLDGGKGNDKVEGGNGNDKMNCGDGNDQGAGDDGSDDIDCGAGNDTVHGGNGNDKVKGDKGNDTVQGDDGDDDVQGGAGSDKVHGNKGNDKLNCGDGNDQGAGDDGSDDIDCGAGNDTVHGGKGNDHIKADKGDDTIHGDDGDDDVQGGTGDDVVSGGAGSDTVDGGDGEDTVDGGAGNDTVTGGAQSDDVLGGAGADAIDTRDASADDVSCGAGPDAVAADGKDRYAANGDCERFTAPVAAKSAADADVSAVLGAQATSCASRRHFKIRLHVGRGVKVRKATVRVQGQPARVLMGRRVAAVIDLRTAPKGRWTVTIKAITTKGKTLKGVRRYRTCAPKLAGGKVQL